jgi:spermidine/putrescine ABC transporter ATP-binding subunit
MTAAVDIAGVGKRFGTTTALDRVDFRVEAGEFVSLLGASGCGKTTLLRIIAGFEAPSEGSVRIYGTDVTRDPPERRPTNLVFQRGALFPHMTVRENVGYGLKLRGWTRERVAARVDEMLSLVRLDGLGDRGPSELSGGQAQRVALARALATEPRVLLLDEPLSALDLKLRQQMQLELRAIQRRLGATFVFVTHDQTEALVMSDRIAVMNRGRIVQHGSPKDVYARPNSIFVADFIGATNLLHGVVTAVDGGSVAIETDAGALVAPVAASTLRAGDRAALSVRPEAVRVRLPDPARPGRISGTLGEIVYQGSSTRVVVRRADGAAVWAEGPDAAFANLSVGDTVDVDWDPAATTILREDTE